MSETVITFYIIKEVKHTVLTIDERFWVRGEKEDACVDLV